MPNSMIVPVEAGKQCRNIRAVLKPYIMGKTPLEVPLVLTQEGQAVFAIVTMDQLKTLMKLAELAARRKAMDYAKGVEEVPDV